ncbi:MAG: Rieske 2Fe-2S domain-containing protein [Planctomycetaceae bacterium]|nr:Rieske 2Fe-2S domain-containing protein [Planctomycetaceae bacterium]
MAHTYRVVGWNRNKRRYDAFAAIGIALFLVGFVVLGLVLDERASADTLVLRALGTAGFVLLHVVLAIGPLARLDRRFLPLLYNRRHLGVMTFVLGLLHGVFALAQYHALGVVNPLVHVLAGEAPAGGLVGLPFQPFGVVALVVLFLMAATSHDFWLANLGALAWKRLHMAVYGAWALLVAHVALGYLQTETSSLGAIAVGVGIVGVLGLHLAAGWRDRLLDRASEGARRDGFVDACDADEVPMDRAKIVAVGGERVAIFRHAGGLSALSNLCRHQGGPLGEGRIVDGCVTCPWHGYQYQPEDGTSPPPFHERVETHRLRLVGRRVWVEERAQPLGTHVPALAVAGEHRAEPT